MVNGLGGTHGDLWPPSHYASVGHIYWHCNFTRLADSVRSRSPPDIFHSNSVGGFLWKVLLAVLYGLAGFFLLANPIAGVAYLTLLLGAFLLVEGIIEIVLYFHIRKVAHAGWVLFDGIITLLLGFFIWAHWPSSSAWVIGTLVGISLTFSGISRFMLALAIRRHT